MGFSIEYTAAITAVKFDGRGMVIDCLPVTVEATDAETADAEALRLALERWPKGEYWCGHTTCTTKGRMR